MSFLYVYPDLFSNEDTGLITGSSPVNEDLGSLTLTADSRENHGSITIFTDIPDPYQLPEAYGSIVDSVDLTDDYGLITESAFGNYISYGELLENILRIDNLPSSESRSRLTYSFSSSGTLSSFGSGAEVYKTDPVEETVFATISGSADTRYFNVYTESASGTLSAIGGAAESRVYSYNDSSVSQSVDYGPILESLDSVDDYGLVNNLVDQILDYAGFDDGFTPYGTIIFSGESTYKEINSEVGSGILSTLSGSAEIYGPNPPENTVLFTITGDVVDRQIESWSASGTLSAIGGAAESRVYSYNDSSTGSESYGLVTQSIDSVDDHGLIIATVDQISDYGGLDDGFTPYGTIIFSGESTYKEINVEVGFGTLSTLSGSAEVYGPNTPENTVLFTITGDATYKEINSEVGSGTLSAVNGAAESRVYSYNESSISQSVDYGSVAQSLDSIDDYGLITSAVDQILDYAGFDDGFTPYGTLILSGNRIEKSTSSYTSLFGTITLSGDALTKREGQVIEIASGNIDVSGDATYKQIESWVASGTISGFGGAAESRVYSYNDSSPGSESYGLVTQSNNSFDDYGLIATAVDQVSDYGGLDDGFTPYGTLIFSGNSILKQSESWNSTGTLNAFGGSAEVYGPNPPENTVLFTISGDATYSDINREVASGTISGFGGAAESRVYSYNDSSSGSESYGLVTQSNNSFDDYGLIISSVDQIADYGGLDDGFTLYGTLIFSGNKVERVNYSYLSLDGTITFSGDALTKREGQVIEIASGNIDVSGDATYKQIESWSSSGTLSAIGGAAESRSYSYNDSSVSQSADYGSVAQSLDSVDDYGFIINSADQIFDYATFNDGFTPYGTIVFSGESTYKEINSEVGSGSIGALSGAAEVYGPNPPENTVLFTITGDATYKEIYNEVASGTLSAIGGAAESRVYSYNDSSSGSESYGLVTQSIDSVDDHGLITSSVDQISDYGGFDDGFTLYGTLILSGNKVERVNYSYLSLDGIITIGGDALTKREGQVIEIASGNIDVSGDATYSDINSEVGSGTLSAIGGAAESRVYSYNDSAISQSADYGSVAQSLDSVDDYGFISNDVDQIFDYATLNEGFTPYGTIVFSGDATYSDINSEVGSGILSTLSGSAEVYGPNPPENIVLFTISGDATYSDINSEVASGTLSAIGGAAESRSYSYNDSSTGSESYGTVGESINSVDDYGVIISPVDQISDYGGLDDGFTPYGTIILSGNKVESVNYSYLSLDGIITISGDAITAREGQVIEIASGNIDVSGDATYKQIESWSASGTLSAIGGAAESRVYSYNDSSTGSESYGLVTQSIDSVDDYGLITNSANQIADYGDLIDGTSPYGTLILSGNKVERVTYSYNESSIYVFGGYEDLGQLSDSVIYEDGGDLTYDQNDSFYENYGYVVDGESNVSPFGTITAFGNAQVIPLLLSPLSGNIDLSGNATYSDVNREVGSGTLSAIGGAAESRSYSYNDSSTGSQSYGLVTQSIDSVDDYGVIISPVDQISDYGGLDDGFTPYGTIILRGDSVFKQTEFWTASGTIDISGSAATKYVPLVPASGTIDISGSLRQSFTPATEIGSGTIGIFGGSAEAYGPNPPENTVLFTISGNVVDRQTDFWTASGTIQISGEGGVPRRRDYISSGIIEISGALAESYTPATEIGSGTLSAFGGSAEAFGPNPPENSVLFTISGDAVDRQTDSWTASGTIEISGSASAVYQPIIVTSGRIDISGDATYSDVNSEVGSGTLSAFGGSVEVYGPNPPENTVLFTIFGDATYSDINSESGSGTVDISGEGSVPRRRDYIGSGSIGALSGAAEVYGPNPPENTVLFTISGDAVDRQTDSWTASGTIEISGTNKQNVQVYVPVITGNCEIEIGSSAIYQFQSKPIIFGGGLIEISGALAESYTPATEIGSGSIGALSGAAEVYGPNPPENTVLFTISGDANTRYFNVYTGPASGTIEISGGISTDKGIYIPNYTASGTVEVSGNVEINSAVTHVGSGIISISGISGESFSRGLYTGSGSFSIFGGHAEEFGANPPEDTVIGTISGAAVPKKLFHYTATGSAFISGDSAWKFAHGNYEGSGTLRTFSGAAEVKVSNPPENTVLFEISGEAIQKVRFAESGIGTATFSGSSVEKYRSSNVGIGTLNISGAATSIAKINNFVGSGLIEISGQKIDKRTFDYHGSGTLSAIRGSAEAFGANPPENVVILTISGDANTRYFNVYTGPASGTIEISGGISTDRQIYAPRITGSGIIRVSGDAGTLRSRSHVSTGIITILGSAKESYIRATYNGNTQINVSGTGSYEYREYEPPFTYVTII